jgi:hypothetical protein
MERWDESKTRSPDLGNPPGVIDGWVTGPPDFVGLGVQRCGTTRWYDLICDHPDVQPTPSIRKELHFFLPYWTHEPDPLQLRRYASYFPRPPGMITGEWSTSYLDPWVPRLLRQAAPKAKLLVSLRDPIARYHSMYAKVLSRVLEDDGQLGAGLPIALTWRGLYSAQIEGLFKVFPREQVHILQFERCVADPIGEIQKTYRFLGIDDDYVPSNLDAHPNKREQKPPLTAVIVNYLEGIYREDVRRLEELLPEFDYSLWPTAAGDRVGVA